MHVAGTITAGSNVGSTGGIDYLYGNYSAGKLFVLGSQYSSAASFLSYAVKAQPGATGYLSSTSATTGRSSIEANSGYVAFFTGPVQASSDGGAVSLSERVRIDQGGNVGIGTKNPTYPLSVNGTIQAKEVIVNTGWADYVFADSYRLAPLSEVEHDIQADKHLPGMPSAQEVAERGLSVGQMQAKLLAKIEELTLHVIEQEKAIRAVRSENMALRDRVTQLESR